MHRVFWRIRQAAGGNGHRPRHPRFGSLRGDFPKSISSFLNRQPGEEKLAGDAVTGEIDKRESQSADTVRMDASEVCVPSPARGANPNGSKSSFQVLYIRIPASRNAGSGELQCRPRDPAITIFSHSESCWPCLRFSRARLVFLTRHRDQLSLCPLPEPRKPSSASLGLTDFYPAGFVAHIRRPLWGEKGPGLTKSVRPNRLWSQSWEPPRASPNGCIAALGFRFRVHGSRFTVHG